MDNKSVQALRIFLCHSSADKPMVRVLYHLLSVRGLEPWLDEEKLVPGENWELEIRNAVRASHIVIVCLSEDAINKAGFVQKEIRYALDIADEQPEGTIFIIPLKLGPCNIPERLCRWQWVDLFEKDGFNLLLKALIARAAPLNISIAIKDTDRQASILLRPENIAKYCPEPKAILVGEILGLVTEGQYEESERKLEAYLTKNPKDYQLLFLYTENLSERYGQKEQVIKILSNKLSHIQVDDPLWAGRLLKIRGVARLGVWRKHRQGNTELKMAQNDFLLSVELNPQVAESYFHLAIINALRGELLAVDTYFEEALKRCTDAEFKVWITKMRYDARNNPGHFLTLVNDFYQ
jgi:tetratricopeptide (TPR) repeat protein